MKKCLGPPAHVRSLPPDPLSGFFFAA